MNITRQYKLYKLGIEIPLTPLKAIQFLEKGFDEFVFVDKVDMEKYPQADFYIVGNNYGVLYMVEPDDKELLSRWYIFWDELKYEYLLKHEEIEKFVEIVVKRKLKFGR